jgi:hypothetical protein
MTARRSPIGRTSTPDDIKDAADYLPILKARLALADDRDGGLGARSGCAVNVSLSRGPGHQSCGSARRRLATVSADSSGSPTAYWRGGPAGWKLKKNRVTEPGAVISAGRNPGERLGA